MIKKTSSLTPADILALSPSLFGHPDPFSFKEKSGNDFVLRCMEDFGLTLRKTADRSAYRIMIPSTERGVSDFIDAESITLGVARAVIKIKNGDVIDVPESAPNALMRTVRQGSYDIEIDLSDLSFSYRHVDLGELRAGKLKMEMVDGVFQVKYDPVSLGGILPPPIADFIYGDRNLFRKEINTALSNQGQAGIKNKI